jgi:hypothetical protein
LLFLSSFFLYFAKCFPDENVHIVVESRVKKMDAAAHHQSEFVDGGVLRAGRPGQIFVEPLWADGGGGSRSLSDLHLIQPPGGGFSLAQILATFGRIACEPCGMSCGVNSISSGWRRRVAGTWWCCCGSSSPTDCGSSTIVVVGAAECCATSRLLPSASAER